MIVSVASGNPYVIADDRARVIDITPTLGRGYSIMTNSYQSICLTVGEMTVPSYNYDCKFSQSNAWSIIPHNCNSNSPSLEQRLLSQILSMISHHLKRPNPPSPGNFTIVQFMVNHKNYSVKQLQPKEKPRQDFSLPLCVSSVTIQV